MPHCTTLPDEVLLDVSVEDGKYRYVQSNTESHVYRHGERWQDVTGNKMIYCAFAEIDALREQIEARRHIDSEVNDLGNNRAMQRDMDALAASHDELEAGL